MRFIFGKLLPALFGLLVAVGVSAQLLSASHEAFLKKDYDVAFREANKEAKRGERSAWSLLGLMYKDGLGAPQDYQAAAYWFQKASDKGDTFAQYELSRMYASGTGVPENKEKAATLLERPADTGFLLAIYDIGVAYRFGVGVKADYVVAHKWLNIAASYPEVDALAPVVQQARLMRTELEPLMTPAQVREAQALATTWHLAKKARNEVLLGNSGKKIK